METIKNSEAFNNERDKWGKILIYASALMFLLMMGSKNVYTAELVVLQGVFSVNKAQVSLAMTYYFITYAVMQILLSFVMGKLNLKIYLTVTGAVSAILTILLGLANSITLMYVLCAVNGIFQAGIYSGCMAVINRYVPNKMLPFGNKIMTACSVLYGVISYGTPALFVGYGLWNVPFILLGILFLLSVVFFFCSVQKMKQFTNFPTKEETNSKTETEEVKPFLDIKTNKGKILYLLLMLLISFLINLAYYAIMSWVPDMLHSVYSMPQEYSILITLVVPLISGAFSIWSIDLCEKRKNIISVSVFFFTLCTLSMLLCVFLYDKSIVFAVILLATFLGANGGGRAVFNGVIAFKMNPVINSGSYLASINAVAAIMAGVVPPIMGAVIDAGNGNLGFLNSYLITLAFTVATIIILIAFLLWYNVKNKTIKR